GGRIFFGAGRDGVGLAGRLQVVVVIQAGQGGVDRVGTGAAADQLGAQPQTPFAAALLPVGDEVGGDLRVVEIALLFEPVESRRGLVRRKAAPGELEGQLGAEVGAARQELSRLLVAI